MSMTRVEINSKIHAAFFLPHLLTQIDYFKIRDATLFLIQLNNSKKNSIKLYGEQTSESTDVFLKLEESPKASKLCTVSVKRYFVDFEHEDQALLFKLTYSPFDSDSKYEVTVK